MLLVNSERNFIFSLAEAPVKHLLKKMHRMIIIKSLSLCLKLTITKITKINMGIELQKKSVKTSI